MNKKAHTTSLYSLFLGSFFSILVLAMCLFLVLVTIISFTRIETSTKDLLNRSIVLAWEEYNRFFMEETTFLKVVASIEDNTEFLQKRNYLSSPAIELIKNKEGHDFWAIIDKDGVILASNTIGKKLPSEFENLIENALEGKESCTSEILQIEEMTFFFPQEIAKQALIAVNENPSYNSYSDSSVFPYVLTQAVGIPIKNSKTNEVVGCLIGGQIVNNKTSIAQSYSSKIPNSYLSIGVKGIRVVANIQIQGEKAINFVGTKQSPSLTEAIEKGGIYNGNLQIANYEIHLVTAEPIFNLKGELVGALSVGIPSRGLTTIQRDTFFSFLACLFLCSLISLVITSVITKRISKPITNLSIIAQEISSSQSVTEKHIEQLNSIKPSKIYEINYLYQSFLNMSKFLYQKDREISNYLEELSKNHATLKHLTEELQKANTQLEIKVRERTKKLEEAINELKALNHIKTQFLANISHELRTPLNSIIGFAEILQDELFGDLNQQQKEYVEIILNSAHDLLQDIEDILDISSIEIGKITIDKQMISLEDIIDSVINIIRPQIKKNKLNLNIKIEDDLPKILADPIRIKQVLANFLSNAIKFTPENGLITVTAFKEGNKVGVSVEDTGIGIKKEDQENIFKEFYQGEGSSKHPSSGVGLGLPLSKKIIDLHNGEIELESEYGKGTNITFYLPIDSESAK